MFVKLWFHTKIQSYIYDFFFFLLPFILLICIFFFLECNCFAFNLLKSKTKTNDMKRRVFLCHYSVVDIQLKNKNLNLIYSFFLNNAGGYFVTFDQFLTVACCCRFHVAGSGWMGLRN